MGWNPVRELYKLEAQASGADSRFRSPASKRQVVQRLAHLACEDAKLVVCQILKPRDG